MDTEFLEELGRIRRSCGCKLTHQNNKQTLETVTVTEKRFWWMSQLWRCSALWYPWPQSQTRARNGCRLQALCGHSLRSIFIRSRERTWTWKIWRKKLKYVFFFSIAIGGEEKHSTLMFSCCSSEFLFCEWLPHWRHLGTTKRTSSLFSPP